MTLWAWVCLLEWVLPTCAFGSFGNGRTCMSSPSTATRCPCLGSAVSGLYEPRLLPPCRAARRRLPVGFCARRWTWWREPGAVWVGQPYSWGNLSWRPMRGGAREGRMGGQAKTRRWWGRNRGGRGWWAGELQQGRAEVAEIWKRRTKRERWLKLSIACSHFSAWATICAPKLHSLTELTTH